MTGSRSNSVRGFAGMLLIAVGGLVFALSGACTVAGVTAALASGGDFGLLALAVGIGFVPIAVGLGLFRWGLHLWRTPAKGQERTGPGAQSP